MLCRSTCFDQRSSSVDTVKLPNSGHPKQQSCLEQWTKCLVPNVTIFVKLPPNNGYLLITDKFFKIHRCSAIQRFQLLSLFVILYHSLPLIVSRCTTRFHSLYHSLSFVVTRCLSLSLVVPLVVTRCLSIITRLSFYKRPKYQRFFWIIYLNIVF